jgi:hypothetical protein
MIVLFSSPLGQQTFAFSSFLDSLASLQNVVRGVGAIICGTLYYLLPIRNYFLRGSLAQIHVNIKNRLLEPCLDDPHVAAAEQRLRQDRTIFDVFYPLIDNDATLKERAKGVRLNGLIWTSTADLTAIAMIMALIYWGAALLVEPRPHYLWLSGVFAVASFLAMCCLLPMVTQRHIRLSNEQLDYIQRVLTKELCRRLRELASKLRGANA